MLIGLEATQLFTFPNDDSPLRMSCSPAMNRKEDAEKHGTLLALASRNICIASASEAAIGLSTNNGLPAAITGRA